MSKIKIKNFGPIKEGCLDDDGYLDIKKVIVFIGSQGSGKSTVAKLISSLMWLEKAKNRGDENFNTFNSFWKLINFQGISDYLSPDTIIEYIGESYHFCYKRSENYFSIENIKNEHYIVPKISYIPAERNTLSAIEHMSGVTGMPAHLFEFYQDLRKAQKELKSDRLTLPINNYEYEFDDQSDSSFVIGPNYKIDLLNASSGVQSFIPLYLVSRNLSNLVLQSDEILRKNMRAESIVRMNEEMSSLEVNDSVNEGEKANKRKWIKAKYLSKCFINIVEEPEQNLFPTSQRHILNSLLEFNNLSIGNKLIMTTHSPYIINFISLAIQADQLKSRIQSEELLQKLNAIVPMCSTIRSSDFALYQLDENEGSIRKLPSYEGIPSDLNFLNQSLADGNDLFDSLLEIEQEI